MNSLLWSRKRTSGLICDLFSPPSPDVEGPWQELRVTLMIEEMAGAPTGNNEKKIQIFLLRPGSYFSVQDHKIRAEVGPGYHDIGLELFEYSDVSGKTDCIEENLGEC